MSHLSSYQTNKPLSLQAFFAKPMVNPLFASQSLKSLLSLRFMTESPLRTRSDLTPASDFLYGSYFDPTLDVTLRGEKQKGIARHPNDDLKIPPQS